MSYRGQIFIPPSVLHLVAQGPPLVWQRGIPTPGVPELGLPAAHGIPDCANLLAANPPSLVEQYEIYSIVIGWTAQITFPGVPPGAIPADLTVDAEVSLLVNGSPVYTNTATQAGGLGSASGLATGTWTADLTNPIIVGPRDQLSLSAGVRPSTPVRGDSLYVGLQALYANPDVIAPSAYPSSISYRVPDAS